MTTPTASGRCLCGAVRFEVRGPLRDVVLCHCVECRRWSGHVFAATAARRRDVAVHGDSLRWIDSPASDNGARRGFCGACGSSLFWEAPGAETISIAAGSLEGPTGLGLRAETYVSQAGDYYAVGGDAPTYERLADAPLSLD